MSEMKGPTFNCPACGKEFKWKPELAGKKGKCKCGGVIQVPAKAPPPPVPQDDDDMYDIAASEEPIAPPSYSPAPAAAAAAPTRAARAPVAAAADEAPAGRQLQWVPALKWFGFGALFAALAVWEFSSPTDPEAGGRRRGIRAVIIIVNNIVGPMGGVIVLGVLALVFLVPGVLILLGVSKDSDHEHEKQQNEWPGSRGKR